jgi:hypothetical protein
MQYLEATHPTEIVLAAESLLTNWTRISINHEHLSAAERLSLVGRVMTLCNELSEIRPCNLTLEEQSLQVLIAPPDGLSIVRYIVAAALESISDPWLIDIRIA